MNACRHYCSFHRSFCLNTLIELKYTYRGCVPKDEECPWSDPWEEQDKTKCKSKDKMTTCICKDDDMCNSAMGSVSVSKGLALATAIVLACWTRSH